MKKHLLLILLLSALGGQAFAEPARETAQAWTPVRLHAVLAAMPQGDAVRGEKLHGQLFCASCHGERGESLSRHWPALSGQRAPYTYKMLLDYRDGLRHEDARAEMMVVLARMMTEQDMADVAAFYAAQPLPGSAPLKKGHPVNDLVRRGDPQRLITPCASCHGVEGQGGRNETPSLAGQRPEYLVRTLRAFRDNVRHNDVHQGMAQFAWDLTDEEIQALAEYYAR